MYMPCLTRACCAVTDPQNTDYEMETGGTRNYEVWHDEKRTTAAHEAQTMTLVDKAEKLRTHFGMERALPVNAVVIARARSTSIIK